MYVYNYKTSAKTTICLPLLDIQESIKCWSAGMYD